MIYESGNRFYVAFMKDGKRYHRACVDCTTKRQAEKFEKELREVMGNFSKQATAEALTTARMNIKAAADCKGEALDSSVIVLEALPLEIVDELLQARKDDLKAKREKLSGKKEITLRDALRDYYGQTDSASDIDAPAMQQSKHEMSKSSNWNDFCDFMAARYPEIETLADVTRAHARAYINLLRTSGRFNKAYSYKRGDQTVSYKGKGGKISNRTILIRCKSLKLIFSRLAETAGLASNPFELDAPTKKQLKANSVTREVFTAEEIALMAANATMPYTKPIFTAGLFTGLTLGDICLLKWDEVVGDWITNKKRRKTGAKLEIPILPPLRALLDEQRSSSNGGEYVFPELAEMYLANPTGVVYRFNEFLSGLGIKSTTKVEGRTRAISTKGAHALRHTFAYIAGMHNIPLAIVQQVLGHLTPEMTRHYESHARREEKELYFKRLAGAFGGQLAVNTPLALPSPGDSLRDKVHNLIDTLPDAALEEIISKYRA